MRKQYIILLSTFLLAIGTTVTEAMAQCRPVFSYEVVAPEEGEEQESVVLSFDEGEQGDYRIRLYDMVKGRFVDEKSATLSAGDKLTFSELPTSSYFIYAWYEGCSEKEYAAIGGKFGIQVGNK
ncbi:MAG: hypothetical protein WBB45_18545 [Cyclobacteriaceae bacterium]